MVACESIDNEASSRKAPVSIPAAPEALDWLEALYSSGVVVAAREGGIRFAPEVKELLHALHQVLAGGKVRVELVLPGDSLLLHDLEEKLARAVDASNRMRSMTDAAVFSP